MNRNEELVQEAKQATENFVDISVMLNQANVDKFALKIENENLRKRIDELYKAMGEMRIENYKLKQELELKNN